MTEEEQHFAHFERIGEAEVRASIEGQTWGEDRKLWARKWLVLRDHERSVADRVDQQEMTRKAASAASRAADAAERAAIAAEEQASAAKVQAREARRANTRATIALIIAAAAAIAAIASAGFAWMVLHIR